jgi:7,8-dihydro-6-hydroxymethylpterin-pyrophosphokinase
MPAIRNGPRAIDLDIIAYDSVVMDSRPEDERVGLDNLIGHLIIPHPRILEREFVLRPLAEYGTSPTCVSATNSFSVFFLNGSILPQARASKNI